MRHRTDVDVTGIEIRDAAVAGRHGGIPIRRYRGDAHDATFVWVHGGAFSHGGLDQLESHAVAVALARRGIEVTAVDYRRVPSWSWFRDAPAGHLPGIRFPVPLDDVADVFAAVAGSGAPVLLGGASAGACLSAAAALRAVREGGPAPTGLVLAYGTFHAQLPPLEPALRRRLRGRHGLVQFRSATVRRMNHNYAGSAEAMREPFAFPGGHDLAGMPRTLMLDADRDSLRASGDAFAQELAAGAVDVERHVVDGAAHGFLDRPFTPTFDAGIALTVDWVIRAASRGELGARA